MKWETYKSLSKKQKEEYDFKFKHIPLPNVLNILMLTVVLFSLVLTFISISAMVHYSDTYSDIKEAVFNILSSALMIAVIGPVIVVILLLIEVGAFCYKLYSRRKWLIKNNIIHPRPSMFSNKK